MTYLTSPLNNVTYHLTQITFFLGTSCLLLVIYRTNRLALTARQNPLALLPMPSPGNALIAPVRRARLALIKRFRLAMRLPAHPPLYVSRLGQMPRKGGRRWML